LKDQALAVRRPTRLYTAVSQLSRVPSIGGYNVYAVPGGIGNEFAVRRPARVPGLSITDHQPWIGAVDF
jgi:hypothetical protein